MRWPALTLLGITCAVLIGITHAAFNQALDCLLGEADLPHTEWADGFGPDGYGT
jgi:hypothetical protein